MTIAVKYQGHPADSNASSWQRKDAYRMDISARLRSEAHFSTGERLAQRQQSQLPAIGSTKS